MKLFNLTAAAVAIGVVDAQDGFTERELELNQRSIDMGEGRAAKFKVGIDKRFVSDSSVRSRPQRTVFGGCTILIGIGWLYCHRKRSKLLGSMWRQERMEWILFLLQFVKWFSWVLL